MPMDVLITEFKTACLSVINLEGSENTLTVLISVINSWDPPLSICNPFMLTLIKWGIFVSKNKDQHWKEDMFWARFFGKGLFIINELKTPHGTWILTKCCFQSLWWQKRYVQNILSHIWKSSKLMSMTAELRGNLFIAYFQDSKSVLRRILLFV